MGSDRKRKRSRSRDRVLDRGDRDRRRERDDRDIRDRDRQRKRSRSRERIKKRSRSRSRDRGFNRRSRSKSRDRERGSRDHRRDKHSSSKSNNTGDGVLSSMVHSEKIDKDKEQEKLEQEMTKRRERIEKWRAEKKRNELEALKDEIKETKRDIAAAKVWSLENDADDDEDEVGTDATNEEDDDPLDAYMNEIQKEVKKTKGAPPPKKVVKKADLDKSAAGNSLVSGIKKKGIVIMSGVAKKTTSNADQVAKRGELMEQNQDGLEYSSEEEKEEGLDTAMDKLAKKGKKDLAIVDHNKIEYLPFKKDFYREVPEIAKMTNGEVETYREDMEGIKVKGKLCPRPVKTWAQCGVSTKIYNILKDNFEKPTPIQAQAIPVVMSGRDMIGIAKTGSGKTLAFLLPLFRHINAQEELEEGDGPIAIIMTPTRELCLQIGKEIKRFQKAIRGAKSVCVYGGTGISEQIAELKRGAEVIVCTPGRMIDMLAANGGRVTNLRRVTMLILDEADRMFDMGFEPQVMRVVDNCRPDKQVVLFSATFPRQMEALGKKLS